VSRNVSRNVARSTGVSITAASAPHQPRRTVSALDLEECALYDSTPAPFGDVTRRWTALGTDARQRHAVRLLGCDCPGDVAVHVDRPGLDAGACYRQQVPAAAAGDPIALGWLATTHRPLLVARGRALLEHDPTAVSLSLRAG
jgi:hypothetical protein